MPWSPSSTSPPKTSTGTTSSPSEISNLEAALAQKTEDDRLARQQQTHRQQTDASRFEDTKIKTMQTDAKLKRAEELNRKLAQELRDLKDRAESLSKKKKTEKKANEFLEDFSKIFDDDVSLIGGSRTGHMFAGPAGDFFGGSSDPVQEYEFKINLLENDLQSVQSENNTLVKSLLQLKQQVREKKAAHDEVSTKLLLQKSSELKREIADADAVQAKLEAKVEELRKKIQQNSDFTQQRHSEEGFEAIQRDIQLLEKSKQVIPKELYDLARCCDAKSIVHLFHFFLGLPFPWRCGLTAESLFSDANSRIPTKWLQR